MGQEILSVKLGQLEEQLDRLHNRIRIGQTSCHSQMRQEIEDLKRECERNWPISLTRQPCGRYEAGALL